MMTRHPTSFHHSTCKRAGKPKRIVPRLQLLKSLRCPVNRQLSGNVQIAEDNTRRRDLSEIMNRGIRKKQTLKNCRQPDRFGNSRSPSQAEVIPHDGTLPGSQTLIDRAFCTYSSVYTYPACTVFYDSAFASSNLSCKEYLSIFFIPSYYCPRDFFTITARKEMNSDEFRKAAHASIDQSMQEELQSVCTMTRALMPFQS